MNGETGILHSGIVTFAVTKKVKEERTIKKDLTEELKETSEIVEERKESRFARLKKSLRKRSASIL